MGLKFEYPREFDRLWRSHKVGVKFNAYKAWLKLGLDKDHVENDWLINYLDKRHKEDAKWVEGKYVPHLSSFLNGRRWEDEYPKIRRLHSHQPFVQETQEVKRASPETISAELAKLKGILH